MKRAEFSNWFRIRMIPLVVLATLAVAATTPLAYWIQKEREMLAHARSDANRVAQIIREAALQRPRLWRYDAQKLAERIAAEGLGLASTIVVRDDRGASVPIHSMEKHGGFTDRLWCLENVVIGERNVATVWIGMSRSPQRTGATKLAMVSVLFALMLGVALYLLPVSIVSKAERRVKEMIAKLAETLADNERRRIARDLHDGVGQLLTAARLHLATLKKNPEGDFDMDGIAKHIDDALQEVRRSTRALMPLALEEQSLEQAIESMCDTMASTSEIHIHCQIGPLLEKATPAAEAVCYRVAQEALGNIVRHASAGNAWVRMKTTATDLELMVEDDGQGIGPNACTGIGTISMHERVSLLDGTIQINKRETGGVCIEVRIPL
jgi:signal transduction histidine kinase